MVAISLKLSRAAPVRGSCRQFGSSALPVPGQELGQAGRRVIIDPAEDIGEPGLRVDVVELGGLDHVYIDAARSPPRS